MELDVERILWHPLQRRILLGCAGGPRSPAELSKSGLARGFSLESISYHFKELHRQRVLVEVPHEAAEGERRVRRYSLNGRLTQADIDAAALKSISAVLASIAEPLAKWIDEPFLDEIGVLVEAAGHQP
jgi:hypothetical protein